MRLFHITNYKLYQEKVPKNIRIVIISDLHFSYKTDPKKLYDIIEQIVKLEPDYILFPGDLIDSINMIEDKEERNRLILWLRELGFISPTLLSIGGHDFYKKENNIWKYEYPTKLAERIAVLDNVHLLDNDKYSDDNIFVTGYTQSMDYYAYANNGGLNRIFNPIKESKEVMIEELKELRNKIGKVPQDKLSMLMVHSPVFLTDKDILELINEYDYDVSGHMHNGCVFPILYELWRSKRGFIAPNKEIFPDNERNTLVTKDDKLIVNGPLTMFQECTHSLQLANALYPYYLTVLDVTNDKEYDTNKIYVKRKYSR